MKSQAQRAYLWMHEPKVAKEFEAATLKGKKLPRHVKSNSQVVGTVKGLKEKK